MERKENAERRSTLDVDKNSNRKSRIKRLLQFILRAVVIFLVPFALLALLIAAQFVRIQIRMYNLQHGDHERLLAACREVIANRDLYHSNEGYYVPAPFEKNEVDLKPPLPESIPDAIREWNPSLLIIRKDYVMIDLNLTFCRIGLIGFTPGAKQFGTFRYMDGLCHSTGMVRTSLSLYAVTNALIRVTPPEENVFNCET